MSDLKTRTANAKPKVLVHLHLYYKEQLGYFFKKLKNIKKDSDYRLIVTLCEDNADIEKKISVFSKSAEIKKVRNTGYDIWPFIQVLKDVNLEEFDYILKLHTKNTRDKRKNYFINNYYLTFFYNWRNCLVDSLIRSRSAFKNNLKTVNNEKFGMVGSKDFIIPASHDNKAGSNAANIKKLFGVDKETLKKCRFVAGTMFLAKASLFKAIKEMPFTENDFFDEAVTKGDGMCAHALERMFGVAVTQQGYAIKGVSCPAAKRLNLYFTLERLFEKNMENIKSFFVTRKKVLLISHNLQFEGAPISLLIMAKLLKKHGYNVEMISLRDGDLRNEYESLNIPVQIMAAGSDKDKKKFYDYVKKFNLVIANTIITFREVRAAKRYTPTLWFIREASAIKSKYCAAFPDLYDVISSTRSIYCVSEYAKKYIDADFNDHAKILHNCCEDVYKGKTIQLKDKTNFSIVGVLQKRKAFDIAIEAFMSMPQQLQDKYVLNIIGSMYEETEQDYWKPLLEKTKGRTNIIWHGNVTGEAKNRIFEETDVFLVPSLDESCSRVVLEASMMGRPSIISENVGAKYMVNENTGWVVKTGSVESLQKCVENILNDVSILPKMGESARLKYLETSTLQIYEQQLIKAVNSNIKKTADGPVLRFVKKFFSTEYDGTVKEIRIFGIKLRFRSKTRELKNFITEAEYRIKKMIDKKNESLAETIKNAESANMSLCDTITKQMKDCAKETDVKIALQNESIKTNFRKLNDTVSWNKNGYEYVRIKKFWEDAHKADFRNLYIRLISGLDAESADTVTNILGKMQVIMNSKDDIVDVFNSAEAAQIRDLKKNFKNKIIKLDDNCFAYGGYLLPENHFETSVFYYRYHIDSLKPDSIKKISAKNIIDAGAFIGDSALILSEYTDKKVYAFEPVAAFYRELLKTMELNKKSNIEPINSALGNKKEETEIFIEGSGSSLKLTYSENMPPEKIKTVTLDEYVKENNIEIGLIKVDVEGFEQEFLKGAENTIKTQKPILLLSIYHTADDFFNIKPLIESWNLGYSLRIVRPVDGNIRGETLLIAEI